jgi:hypothetical protein
MVASGCDDVCYFADEKTVFYSSVEVYDLKKGIWSKKAGTLEMATQHSPEQHSTY